MIIYYKNSKYKQPMNIIDNSKELKNILIDLNNKEFNNALNKLKVYSKNNPSNNLTTKLFASIYFKKMDWKNAIKYYEKTLSFEKEIFKTYINIGVAFFKLGKINNSISAFKKSINENSNFDLAYNNLGISYLEIGMYAEAINNFALALQKNKENISAQKNLINTLNFSRPLKIDSHLLINLNDKITKIVRDYKITDFNKLKNIKKILHKGNEIIKNLNNNFIFDETQIFRRNSKNLNCNRHFKIFNEFNIIPKYCFSCYKIQINLKKIIDLIKLYFIFDNLYLEKNNIRKCVVEIRENIKGNYKGYIYCEGLTEAQMIIEKINEEIDKAKFDNFKISIKHGCTEFYKSYPKYEKINYNGDQEMAYNEDWERKEIIIDKINPTRINTDKKILGETLKGINLSDILIINNWITYADAIGDYSYKLIYEKNIKPSFINKILETQIEFRKRN